MATSRRKYIELLLHILMGKVFQNQLLLVQLLSHVDSGDAVFAMSGSTYAGKVLTADQSSSDPDGDGPLAINGNHLLITQHGLISQELRILLLQSQKQKKVNI